MRRTAVALCCLVAVLSCWPLTAPGAMIPLENMLTSSAYSGKIRNDELVRHFNVVPPFSSTDKAMVGDTSNTTVYGFLPTAEGATLEFQFDHAHDDGNESTAESRGSLFFQVSQVTEYSVAANYASSGGERTIASVKLFDNLFSDVDPVFFWNVTALGVQPREFRFDDAGELRPGNSYRLQYQFMIDSINVELAAAAVGHLSFLIGDSVMPGLEGDANGDGRVDITDLNLVRNHFGDSGASDGSLPGDVFPFDGDVDIGDLNAVRNHFGAEAISVPEPAALVLAAWATLCGWLLWRPGAIAGRVMSRSGPANSLGRH